MTLQQITDSACESFDEKFVSNGIFDNLILLGDNPDVIEPTQERYVKAIKSHLISSIKKAVEMAYKEIEVEEKEIPEGSVVTEDYSGGLMEGECCGYNDCLSLIEKKKSLFLNK